MGKYYLKNIEYEKVLALSSLVEYQEGQVVSRTLCQNSAVSLTLFAFDEGEEISTHTSKGDAVITVMEGSADITIADNRYLVEAGQTIVMPSEIPHAVYAQTKFKMLLTVVFP